MKCKPVCKCVCCTYADTLTDACVCTDASESLTSLLRLYSVDEAFSY